MTAPIRLAIVQRRLSHYRLEVFNGLARSEELDLVVVHSGQPSEAAALAFEERTLRPRRLGPFHFQPGLGRALADCDVVIAMLDPHFLGVLWHGLRNRHARWLWWGHGRGRTNWVNWLRLWLARRAGGLICYREENLQWFRERGLHDSQLYVAPNTIHVPNASYDSAKPRQYFLFVGRLQRRKKLDELLRAFATCRRFLPEHVTMEIVGPGVEVQAELEELATALALRDRLRFHGRIIDSNRLKDLFQGALAYVSPGHVGLGALHSFAYGVPVVASRDSRHPPEFNDVSDGVSGLLYEGGQDGLAQCLIRLAADPQLSHRLGAEAHRMYMEERTIDRMIAGLRAAVRGAGGEKWDS